MVLFSYWTLFRNTRLAISPMSSTLIRSRGVVPIGISVVIRYQDMK